MKTQRVTSLQPAFRTEGSASTGSLPNLLARPARTEDGKLHACYIARMRAQDANDSCALTPLDRQPRTSRRRD
eukprot:8608663-Lingulodinium_polyedra.AAC.1